jgi:hypothetical protein
MLPPGARLVALRGSAVLARAAPFTGGRLLVVGCIGGLSGGEDVVNLGDSFVQCRSLFVLALDRLVRFFGAVMRLFCSAPGAGRIPCGDGHAVDKFSVALVEFISALSGSPNSRGCFPHASPSFSLAINPQSEC